MLLRLLLMAHGILRIVFHNMSSPAVAMPRKQRLIFLVHFWRRNRTTSRRRSMALTLWQRIL
eukprot:CCRYP_000383-RA/>CCRYP_000383-RA protein AED:0.46 eAED:1.00 QI:0/-1/0/1/-1/0/1/0/61